MGKSRIIWSCIFIIVGIVFVLSNYGAISWGWLKDWWKLWPLIFVAIGVVLLALGGREKKIEGEKK